MYSRVVRTVCQSCHCECGVLVEVRNNKVTKITGDSHPMNEGLICPKGIAAVDLLYHPDRLMYPLKRSGGRGEGKWQRISWDEALDTISFKFQEIAEKYGALSNCIWWGTGPRGYEFLAAYLSWALGCNGTNVAHVCFTPSIIAGVATYGVENTQERGPDYQNTKCILIWGANPEVAHPPIGQKILAASRAGAKLIVVDPRKTKLASRADVWLQVRPGTDDALALGMLNVIINEELYEHEFVERWCVGFEKLRQRVQEYPTQRVAEITWVPEENIKMAARLYATIKPAVLYHRVAIEQHTNSIQTLRALYIMIALTGNIDVKGGNLIPKYPDGFRDIYSLSSDKYLQPPGKKAMRLGADMFPLFSGPGNPVRPQSHLPTVVKATVTSEPYPIKGVITFSNSLLHAENTKEVWQGFKNLEFTAAVDFFPTPTAELADIVLPSATWLEKDEVAYLSYDYYISSRQKVIEPLGECWDDKKIIFELAKRLGVKKWFPWDSVEEYLDYQLKPLGITFSEFREKGYILGSKEFNKYSAGGFNTPSKKVELYSSVFERHGYDPLPYYEENPESPVSAPALTRKYPFILITGGRHIAFFHSEGRQIDRLRRMCPDPVVEIHPKTAEKLGITNGQWVWIETPRGKVKQKAKFFKGIHPQVIHAQHNWWFPEKKEPEHGLWDSNINVVASNNPPYDPVCGSTPLRGLLCRVYRVGDAVPER